MTSWLLISFDPPILHFLPIGRRSDRSIPIYPHGLTEGNRLRQRRCGMCRVSSLARRPCKCSSVSISRDRGVWCRSRKCVVWHRDRRGPHLTIQPTIPTIKLQPRPRPPTWRGFGTNVEKTISSRASCTAENTWTHNEDRLPDMAEARMKALSPPSD